MMVRNKVLFVVGIVLLGVGLSLIVLSASGIRLFEVTGTCTVKGTIVDADTGEYLTAAGNILDANGYPTGKSIVAEGSFVWTNFPAGTWGIEFRLAYYNPYTIPPREWVAGQTYDLGVIKMKKLDVSGAKCKLEYFKTIVDGKEQNYAAEGQAIQFCAKIRNVGTTLGYFYVDVYDSSGKLVCNLVYFMDLKPDEYIVAYGTPNDLTMPAHDVTLTIKYGHKTDIYGTKAEDGQATYTIYYGQPPIPLQTIVGVCFIGLGAVVTLYSSKR